ncbi:MAG: class I SAM-dependent methyltransferase [Candidatus Thorarchaeota archaeon]
MRKVHLYDESAEVYHQRYLQIQRTKYHAATPFLQNGPLLDVGIGTGIGLPSIAKFTPTIGVDGAIEMLRIAFQQVQCNLQWQTSISFICASAEALPFRNHVFSTVVSITVIQNLNNVKAGADELQRVGQTGGILVVTTLAKALALKELERFFDPSLQIIAHLEQIANEDDGLIFQL